MNPSAEELLFSAACSFEDVKERGAFLDVACRGDLALRARLEEMLAIEEDAASFFEFQPSVARDEAEVPGNPEEEGLGAQIGRYRLVTRIGAGGCGVVYYAKQEEPVRRKVALKIVKLGMDTEAVVARFEQERQMLAQMDHPSIARVLDAGATASGRPYFVMELVDGEKITQFCDVHRLSIRQRLELFVEVCRAIQHAHQKGLIHRDIKPSNVLVHFQDSVAVPKVIDFGIAKATAASVGEGATFTHRDQFLGTPAYMSPEQAQGSADVDTRSDIYSLGVLLYELLCGRPPFELGRLTDSTMDEMRRVIREDEPKRPSVAFKMSGSELRATVSENRSTNPPNLESQLARDLDWIVMKAMEKERSRRYETANGLAVDVLRCLNDEPVHARPPSRAYRMGKLAHRNKLLFTAGAIALVGLLAGFGISTWMYFREKSAREEQSRLRENAERLWEKADIRERVVNAAVKVKYGDIAAADVILASVAVEKTPASLEAANTYSAVANWHVKEGRLKDAAARFNSMIRALSSADASDLPDVSFDFLPTAATIAYGEGAASYEGVRRVAITRFSGTSNPVVAEQALKACIVLPANSQTLEELKPMAGVLEKEIESKVGKLEGNISLIAWGCFAMSLWNYRNGDYAKGAEWGDRCLAVPEENKARSVSALIVRSMIEKRLGRTENAEAILGACRESVWSSLSGKIWTNTPGSGYWFDWVIAALLFMEADRLVASGE